MIEKILEDPIAILILLVSGFELICCFLYFIKLKIFIFLLFICRKLINNSHRIFMIRTSSYISKKISENLDNDKKLNMLTIVCDIFFCFVIMYASINLIYIILSCIFYLISNKFNLGKNVDSYLSLTCILCLIAYVPDKVLFLYNKIELKFKKDEHFIKSKKLKQIMSITKSKLVLYGISIFITVINSIEKIGGKPIIDFDLWLQYKPVVFESVLTVIVIDRFIETLMKRNVKEKLDECKKK